VDLIKILKEKSDLYFDFNLASKWRDEITGQLEIIPDNIDFKLLVFFL